MKLNINYVAWGLIALFSIIILINAQSIKQQLINSVNSNSDRGNLKEGFSFGQKNNTDIDDTISRKIKATTEELGGKDGCNEIKKTLEDMKKSCGLECAKCMMNIIGNNTTTKTINIEKIAKNMNDSKDDPDCIKYKQYTELSKNLQNIIDNM